MIIMGGGREGKEGVGRRGGAGEAKGFERRDQSAQCQKKISIRVLGVRRGETPKPAALKPLTRLLPKVENHGAPLKPQPLKSWRPKKYTLTSCRIVVESCRIAGA